MKYFVVWVMMVMLACGQPGYVLPVNTMKQLVVDLSRTEEYVNNYLAKDTALDVTAEINKRMAAVYVLYGTTEEQFLQSMQYYRQDPKRLRTLMDSINMHANRLRDQTFADTLSAPPTLKKPTQR